MWVVRQEGKKERVKAPGTGDPGSSVPALCILSVSSLRTGTESTLSLPCCTRLGAQLRRSPGLLTSHCPISLWIWADQEHWRTDQRSQQGGPQSLRARAGHPTTHTPRHHLGRRTGVCAWLWSSEKVIHNPGPWSGGAIHFSVKMVEVSSSFTFNRNVSPAQEFWQPVVLTNPLRIKYCTLDCLYEHVQEELWKGLRMLKWQCVWQLLP